MTQQKKRRPLFERVYNADGTFGLSLNLHPGQQKAWDSDKRIVAILAGSQGGKTSFLPWLLHREIENQRGVDPDIPQDYLAVTANYDLFKLKFLPALREVFENETKSGRYWSGTRVIELADPSTGQFKASRADDPMYGRIILRSADSPAGLESATARAALLDEAGMNSFTIETKEAIDRRLSITQGRIFIGTTLYNLGWLKSEVYDKWKGGDPDIDVIQFDSTLNPAYPRNSYEKAKASMPLWRFNMMYRGIYTRPAGQIYDKFDDKKHTCARFEIPSTWDRYMGLDFGSVNTAAVFLARKPGTRLFFLYRAYKAGSRTARQHADLMFESENRSRFRCIGGSKSEEAWRLEYQAAGLNVEKPPIWDVEVGIDRVYSLFGNDQIIVFNDLQAVIDDIIGYSRVVDPNGTITEDIDDKSAYHYADAIRYIGTVIASPDKASKSTVAKPVQPIVTPRTVDKVLIKRGVPVIPGFKGH